MQNKEDMDPNMFSFGKQETKKLKKFEGFEGLRKELVFDEGKMGRKKKSVQRERVKKHMKERKWGLDSKPKDT